MGRYGDALEVYGGEVLDGVTIPQAPPFMEWLGRQRTKYARLASACAWREHYRALASGDRTMARELLVVACERSPRPDTILDRVLPALVQLGGEKEAVQLFEREKVLFLAVGDYLQLEDATPSSAMVLLLTQLVTTNYELLLGKFQLNPSTGEISLSVEINLDDGLGFRTFHSVADHLVRTADRRYPELARAAAGNGM